MSSIKEKKDGKKITVKWRMKSTNYLMDTYMKHVLKFIGLRVERKRTQLPMLAWVGDAVENKNPEGVFNLNASKKTMNSGEPNWFINDKVNPPRVYTFIESMDQYIVYKHKRTEHNIEWFNVFGFQKYMQLLLLLMIPNIYERYCLTGDNDGMDDYIDELLHDQIVVPQEELLRHINIKYFPLEMDIATGDKIFHYEMIIARDNGETNCLVSKSRSRVTAIMMIMMQVLALIDDTFDMDDMVRIQDDIETRIEKWEKERTLNIADSKKVMIERNIEMDFDEWGEELPEELKLAVENKTSREMNEMSVETASSADGDASGESEDIGKLEEANKKKSIDTTAIDLTESCRDLIQFNPNMEDDDDDPLMRLDYEFA